MNEKNIIRTSIRIPMELYEKVEMFGRENKLKTFNSATKKLLELGLLFYLSDTDIKDYLLKIANQNDYIIKILEESIYGNE